MLLSAVSVLVVAQSSSEIPEGLMNNPVFGCCNEVKEPFSSIKCGEFLDDLSDQLASQRLRRFAVSHS